MGGKWKIDFLLVLRDFFLAPGRIVLAAVLFFMLSCSSSAPKKGDPYKRCHVKSKTLWRANYLFGAKDSNFYKAAYVEYDWEGREVLSEEYYKSGELKTFSRTKYDNKGHIKLVWDSLPSDRTFGYIRTYLCSADGNPVQMEKRGFRNRMHLSTSTYEYDEAGNRVRAIEKEGEWIWRAEMTYDRNGNGVEREEYFNDKLKNRIEYEYDSLGNLVRTQSFSGPEDKSFYNRACFTYDDSGLILSGRSYSFSRPVDEVVFTYSYY